MKRLDVDITVCIRITNINSTTSRFSKCEWWRFDLNIINEVWKTYWYILAKRSGGALTLISAKSWQNRRLIENLQWHEMVTQEMHLRISPKEIKICSYSENALRMSHYLRPHNNAGWKSQDYIQKEVRTRVYRNMTWLVLWETLKIYDQSFTFFWIGKKGHRKNTQKLLSQTNLLAMVWELRKLVNNNHRAFHFRIKSTKPTSWAP